MKTIPEYVEEAEKLSDSDLLIMLKANLGSALTGWIGGDREVHVGVYATFRLLQDYESKGVARSWLMGMNPMLGEDGENNPLKLIQEGKRDLVMRVAWANAVEDNYS